MTEDTIIEFIECGIWTIGSATWALLIRVVVYQEVPTLFIGLGAAFLGLLFYTIQLILSIEWEDDND